MMNDSGNEVQAADDSILLLEKRSFRPFKTSEDYLYAMREDLAEWLNNLYELDIHVDNFFQMLENGVVLCQHANNVNKIAEEYKAKKMILTRKTATNKWDIPYYDVYFRHDATAGSFFARDNIHNFIKWCRDLGVHEVLMFETDDLVMRKNEKHVILALLEIARRCARFGIEAPLLVKMEEDIDREMEADRIAEERRLRFESQELLSWQDTNERMTEPPLLVYGPQQQIITNDLKSLDEMVRELVERCTCPSQFPMIKVSEGKYRIGDTKVLIFVRILRNHVMVRVGGGWDTLHHYLDKHDPCRCKSGHRFSNLSKVAYKNHNNGERQLSSVTYERPEDNVLPPSPMNRRKNSRIGKKSLDTSTTGHPSRMDCRDDHVPSSPDVWCDSSSEVSDEGYKSQGHPRSSSRNREQSKKVDIDDIMERPDSSMTQVSSEGSSVGMEDAVPSLTPTNDENNSPKKVAKTPNKSKFSFIENINNRLLNAKKVKKNSTPDRPAWNSGPGLKERTRRSSSSEPLENHPISRSQSVSSENGFGSPLKREPLRQSCRVQRKNGEFSGKKTWNGRGKDYPGLSPDTYRSTMPRSIRSASSSPAMPRRRFPTSGPPTPCKTPKRSAPTTTVTSPGMLPNSLIKTVNDPNGKNDLEVLMQLEEILNSYRTKVVNKLAAEGKTLPPELEQNVQLETKDVLKTPKITPRKSSVGSRIPAPTFFKGSQTEI